MRPLTAALIAGLLAVPDANAQPLRVDITEGARAPLQISLATNAGPGNAADLNMQHQLLQIVQADLATTALYELKPHGTNRKASVTTELLTARAQGSQGLVWLTVRTSTPETIQIECAYYDVYSGTLETGQLFALPASGYRRAAHKCADLVYSHTSGHPAYFDSSLAIVTNRGTITEPARAITIVDSDGFNPRDISPVPARMVDTPAISRDGRLVAYILIEAAETFLVIHDRTTGTNRRVRSEGAAMSMPAFSPDGKALLLTLSQDGEADIHKLDLETGTFTRLTNSYGTDTAASYSPAGDLIVFQSDRSGMPQVYVMKPDGSAQHRISFGNGSFAAPAWNPAGDRIAFTLVNQERMQIGTMRPDGTAMVLLSASGQDESPTWAANSRVLLFTRTLPGKLPQLWNSDLSGQRQTPLPLKSPAAQAAWSGVLP